VELHLHSHIRLHGVVLKRKDSFTKFTFKEAEVSGSNLLYCVRRLRTQIRTQNLLNTKQENRRFRSSCQNAILEQWTFCSHVLFLATRHRIVINFSAFPRMDIPY